METLLPDQLKALWQTVENQQISREDFVREEQRLMGEYRTIWADALLLPGQVELESSILREIGDYVQCDDLAEIQRRCDHAVSVLKDEWHEKVKQRDQQSVTHYYDTSQGVIYELMGWHTLRDDTTPLAYVAALHFARQHGCQHYLDFGAGVGSGGLLFARHGFAVTLADISSTMLNFSRWRFTRRQLAATYLDLKIQSFPQQAVDFITAMDVFEHLLDPAATVDQLNTTLKPGGFLFARLAADDDDDRPQHIIHDFTPALERLRALGFVEVWCDEWLWGHQVFRKA